MYFTITWLHKRFIGWLVGKPSETWTTEGANDEPARTAAGRLASDEGSYISGARVAVTGGRPII